MDFELIKRHIDPVSCLDIGANSGAWHNEARLHWPNAYFFLIEANPECAEAIAQTGASHRITALSDCEKDVTFYTRKDAPGCTGCSYKKEVGTPFYEGEKAVPHIIRTQRLDDVVEGMPFQLIKIDTQGSELEILRGGLNTLASAKAVVMELSLTIYNEGSPLADEQIEFMASQGFYLAEKLGTISRCIEPFDPIQEDALFLRK